MIIFWIPSLLQALLCTSFCYCVYYIYWHRTTGASRRRLVEQYGCKPPKKLPSTDLLLGLDKFWEGWQSVREHRALELTQHRWKSNGVKTGQVYILGQSLIATIEPENIKTVLSLDFKSYELGDARKKTMTPLLGEGIFTTDGPAWQHSRELLRPNFARHQLVEDLEMFERHLQHLMNLIPEDRSTVDLQEKFFGFTLDVATEFLFGQSTNCQAPGSETEGSSDFVKAFMYCQNNIEGAGPLGVLSLFLPDLRFNRECKVAHAFVDRLIERASVKHQPEPDMKRLTFLQQLSAETSDKTRIRSELLNLLLAGRDTTAALLSNIFFMLARLPDVQKRLRKEITDVVGDGLPSYENLKNMKYLRAILNEALRLYPVVPEESRQAIANTVLPLGGGDDEASPVLVKKGQLVAWSPYTLHRREDIYGEDAAEFKPERWLDGEGAEGSKGLRVGWEYVPFNGGPRICIGQQFALTEASYVTSRLLQEFPRLECRDSRPWQEHFTLTCQNLNGCKVAMTRRS